MRQILDISIDSRIYLVFLQQNSTGLNTTPHAEMRPSDRVVFTHDNSFTKAEERKATHLLPLHIIPHVRRSRGKRRILGQITL